ncbi:hypothetical protein GE300_06600 [Rhodobacteraceae bacterium 2CG4]|uniref:Transmembrane protein n=2 Tax=Halovulum marinum TaxID=2662447 RepID=A0A6L5YYK5_9RHOB|nr:hypothetical protein [Halovulum marinum]
MFWRQPRDRSLWHMILAPTIWALHFVLVYGVTAVLCAKWDAADLARLTIFASTAVALTLIVAVGRGAWRQWDYLDGWDDIHDRPTDNHRRRFLGHVGFLLSLVSTIGVIYVTLPAVFVETCR